MQRYEILLNIFTEQSKDILGENLTGIYLHGSAAMGCFHWEKSDLDLIVVVKKSVSDKIKRQYMDMVIRLNEQAPAKGIEMSIVREDVCSPFVYPTPYELHFSKAHIKWYQEKPEDYIEKMRGADKDLAAHFTIIYYRGRVLYGKEIKEVFAKVNRTDYFDSIWLDIENAEEEIFEKPVYITLNLCRVLAYKRDNKILSKQEGGKWGLENVPEKYIGLVEDAVKAYDTGGYMKLDELLARGYAEYMLKEIMGEF